MEEERREESVELVRFPFSNERKHPAHVVQTVNLWGQKAWKSSLQDGFQITPRFAESNKNAVAFLTQASIMER